MLSSRAKTHNYLNMIVSEQSVKAHDPEGWAVMLDINGNLAEGIGSKIFLAREGTAVFSQRAVGKLPIDSAPSQIFYALSTTSNFHSIYFRIVR